MAADTPATTPNYSDDDALKTALHAVARAETDGDNGPDIAADDVGASKLGQEIGEETPSPASPDETDD